MDIRSTVPRGSFGNSGASESMHKTMARILVRMSRTAEGAEGPAPDPLIRVVRGTPTPEEVAALVGVLVRHARPAAAPLAATSPGGGSLWAALARPGFAHRPTSWRATALPGARGL